MTETEFQVVKSVGFVAALGLASALQWLSPHAGSRGSWRVNGALWALNAAVLGLLCAGCACTVSRWAASEGLGLLHLPAAATFVTGAPWLGVVLGVVALDLVSYVWHRANHRVSLLWRFHQAHHSDPDFTVSTALRFHPGELVLALPVRLVAVASLGLSIPAIIVFEVVFALANFVEHGDIDLPRGAESAIARVFVTPALHRRHHSRRRALLDTNYGTIFSVWDRLFGSFGPSDSMQRYRIGLPGLAEHVCATDVLAMPARGVFRGEAQPPVS